MGRELLKGRIQNIAARGGTKPRGVERTRVAFESMDRASTAMRLDPVHDLQRVFRKILAGDGEPRDDRRAGREAELLDLELPANKGVVLVALALLDAETSFSVLSTDPEAQVDAIAHMTYARAVADEAADFIFAIGEAGAARAAEAIAQARPGTLVDPHLGATIVVEARSLSEAGSLLLSGPGIESSARLGVGLEADGSRRELRRTSSSPSAST